MVVGSWVVVGLYMVRWWWDGGIADGAWVGMAWVRYVLHDPDHNVARKRDADQVVQLCAVHDKQKWRRGGREVKWSDSVAVAQPS